jgi:hypothetical protein
VRLDESLIASKDEFFDAVADALAFPPASYEIALRCFSETTAPVTLNVGV